VEAEALEQIKRLAIDRYIGHVDGVHGLSHWERVRENGVRLSDQAGVDRALVVAFAYLHDCCRENDGTDYDHGLRAAGFAAALHGSRSLAITDEQLGTLMFACEHHAKGFTSDDPTIGACWDSDRLDLGRVGAIPDPELLSTPLARTKAVINWAYGRSITWNPL
jgi:uncharacterized protein